MSEYPYYYHTPTHVTTGQSYLSSAEALGIYMTIAEAPLAYQTFVSASFNYLKCDEAPVIHLTMVAVTQLTTTEAFISPHEYY